MKRLVIVFIIILVSSSGYSQDTTFSHLIYALQGSSTILSLKKVNEYTYSSYSSTDTPYTGVNSFGIIKYDSVYNIIQTSAFNVGRPIIPPFSKGFDISFADSSFVMVGSIRFFIGYQTAEKGYIIRFNKNLDTLWTKKIDHPDTAYADTCQWPSVLLKDIKLTSDGNYLIAGNYNHKCNYDWDRSFLIKMNNDGEIIWQKFLNPIFQSVIGGIELDDRDSGFYCVLRYNSHHYLYKFNKLGNIEWSVPYNQKTYVGHYYGLKVHGDTIIAASVYFPSLQNTVFRLTVASINSQTQTVNWVKDFPYNMVSSTLLRYETIKIIITESGNIAIGMSGLNDSVGNRPHFLMLSPNGDSLWCRYYFYNVNSQYCRGEFSDLISQDDGGFLIGGSFSDPNIDPIFWKAWLIKTDSNGIAPGAFTVSVEEQILVIKRETPIMYPIPATDQLNIRLHEQFQEPLSLEVYNLAGQLVMQEQMPPFDTECRINIHDLPGGTYLIRLFTRQELLYSDKFIKR